MNWELGSGTSTKVKQALDIMMQWTPMDLDNALQLLTPAFKQPTVRRYVDFFLFEKQTKLNFFDV